MSRTSEILDPRGVPTTFMRSALEPPKGSSPWFGWIDPAGDPCSVKMDTISAVVRDARSGRFIILLQNTNMVPALSDEDAMRLMKRFGWTETQQHVNGTKHNPTQK